MDDWFHRIGGGSELSADQVRELDGRGFIVLQSAIEETQIKRLRLAYDHAVATADPDDVHTGRTTTRVTDFVNRGPAFEEVYVLPALLDASHRIIGRPFKLSSMHARTLRPGMAAQPLHMDVEWDSADWPLTGFILMVDEFRPDNGATRFVPGSHRLALENPAAQDEVKCFGEAGSMIIFNGSVLHGHSPNASACPRRSIQGAFIPRTGQAGNDFASRMQPETLERIGPLGRYLLDV